MKTIEQTRRELFRKIFANAPYEFSMACYTRDSTSCPDNYVSYHVKCAWQAFNAALDAVVIELPTPIGDDHGGCIHNAATHDSAVSDCRTAIESTNLGLKII